MKSRDPSSFILLPSSLDDPKDPFVQRLRVREQRDYEVSVVFRVKRMSGFTDEQIEQARRSHRPRYVAGLQKRQCRIPATKELAGSIKQPHEIDSFSTCRGVCHRGIRYRERSEASTYLSEKCAAFFGLLHLSDLGFFSFEQVVDLARVLIRELLNAVLPAPLLVLADLALRLEVLHVLVDVDELQVRTDLAVRLGPGAVGIGAERDLRTALR